MDSWSMWREMQTFYFEMPTKWHSGNKHSSTSRIDRTFIISSIRRWWLLDVLLRAEPSLQVLSCGRRGWWFANTLDDTVGISRTKHTCLGIRTPVLVRLWFNQIVYHCSGFDLVFIWIPIVTRLMRPSFHPIPQQFKVEAQKIIKSKQTNKMLQTNYNSLDLQRSSGI